MRTLVTGASGFVGRHALEALGEGAVGLYRHNAPSGGRVAARWEKDELARALEGMDTVVHAASVVHRPKTPAEEYVRFNVEGTAALLDAARAAGVRRFVFMSSIKVHGETPVGTIDEHTPVAAEAHYARTKADAERLVLAATDLRPVVLRLCPVYGRGDKGNVRTMIRAIRRRRFFVPGDGSTRKSIVHATTVAEVVRAAAASDAGGVFVVADRETPSIRELADAIARALSRRRPLAIPKPLLIGAASVVGRAARLARMKTAISGELVEKATRSSVCDPSRAIRELDVRCHVDLDWALGDEIAWLRAADLL
ncbi:MAG TPA: NAD-dependent epimerase/dehydratase family protein [Labilithrix sp.]